MGKTPTPRKDLIHGVVSGATIPPPPRQKLVWTRDLHARFLAAVTMLGASAKPSEILYVMNVRGLTRKSVASHLQKYRKMLAEELGAETQRWQWAKDNLFTPGAAPEPSVPSEAPTAPPEVAHAAPRPQPKTEPLGALQPPRHAAPGPAVTRPPPSAFHRPQPYYPWPGDHEHQAPRYPSPTNAQYDPQRYPRPTAGPVGTAQQAAYMGYPPRTGYPDQPGHSAQYHGPAYSQYDAPPQRGWPPPPGARPATAAPVFRPEPYTDTHHAPRPHSYTQQAPEGNSQGVNRSRGPPAGHPQYQGYPPYDHAPP